MFIKRSPAVLVLVVLMGCQYLPWGKKEAKPIFVGEPETIIVEPPEDAVNLAYRWGIVDLPDQSLLVPDFNPSSNVYTFTADVEGDYTFSAIVEAGTEEVADYVFRFIAVEDTSIIPRQPAQVIAARQPEAKPLADPPKPKPEVSKPVASAAKSVSRPARRAVSKQPSKPSPRKWAPDVVPGHFTIQISSWKTAKQAQRVKRDVESMGFDVYIQRVWLKDVEQVWWRVRLGDFTDVAEARRVRETLADRFADVWVDNVRKDVVETD